MDWLKKLFTTAESTESTEETIDGFNLSPQEKMEAIVRNQIIQEDQQMKAIEEEREAEENAVEGQLIVIDGAKIKMGTHMGEFKVLNDVPTTQDKLTGTIIEKQIANFIFYDGFQLLSVTGDLKDQGTMKVQDNDVILKKSTLAITGKMPGNKPPESGNIGFEDSGQIHVPENLITKKNDDNTIKGFWINLKEQEIEKAILGEEVKIKLLLNYAVGTNLTLIVIAQEDASEIFYSQSKAPIEISFSVPDNKEFISEAIHLNPHYFFKKNSDIKFYFSIKECIAFESDPLFFSGFGKPDLFKKDAKKSYMYELLDNGTSVAYVSGNRLDILTYQDWFENESDELSFSNKEQLSSYFDNVYLTYLFRWSIEGGYGSENNRSRIIAAFEKAGKKYNIPPSVLYLYATGEGMKIKCDKGKDTNLDIPVNSYQALGLDFFEIEVRNLKVRGYLDKSFNSAGTVIFGKVDVYPRPFNGKYAIIRFSNGTTLMRQEAADKGEPVSIYPVIFKNIEAAIEGACALYARSYADAAASAKNIGWGDLTLNQNVFFGYIKIQKTSTKGNAELNRYRKKNNPNFLDENYSSTKLDSGVILNKSYHRWVAWRYILLGKHFSK